MSEEAPVTTRAARSLASAAAGTPSRDGPQGAGGGPGLLDVLDAELLAAIAEDYLPLLGTSTSIHDRSGKRALGLFPSGWCSYLDRESRRDGGHSQERWSGGDDVAPTACQQSCWHASESAIEQGREIEEPCGSGISMFAVPILAGNRVVGAINAAVGAPPLEGPRLVQLAEAYGVNPATLARHAAAYSPPTPEAQETAKRRIRRAAQLIGEMVAREAAERERERLLQAEAHARARLQRLQTATAAFARALTLEEVAAVASAQGAEAMEATGSLVALVSADGTWLEGIHIEGADPRALWGADRVALDEAVPCAAAVRTGMAVFATDADALRERFAAACLAAAGQIEAVVALPLVAEDTVLGTISYTFDGPREFTAEDLALLEALAEQATAALRRVQLLASEREARRRTEHVQRLTAALATALTPNEVAGAMLAAGVREVGAPRGSVLLLREDRHEFELLAFSGYDPAQMEEWRRFPSEGPLPVADAVHSGHPVVIGRRGEFLQRYPVLTEWVGRAGFAGSAIFPLLVGSGEARRVLGVLCFDLQEEREFPPDEIAFLETITSLSAQAMDRALAYAAERAARMEAEHANQAKASFLAVMSHELRTPLNAIGGYTQLLEMGLHGPTTPEQLAALNRISFNQQALLERISDILDFARLEAGRVTYDMADLPVAEVVASVGPLVEPIVTARGLSYDVVVPEDAPAVRADPTRLRQVLVNLLANAAKFTQPGGGIRLEATSSRDAVRLSVSDTGAGIPAEKLDTIFEPFERVESSYNRQTEGAGLGLAIARDLARGMGGDLLAESVFGTGSTFTVILRRADAARSDAARSPAS